MEFLTYQPLIWLGVVVILAIGLRFSLVDQPGWQRFLSFALRVAGIVLLIVALCRPFASDHSQDVHVVFVVDVSQSVDLGAARSTAAEIGKAIENLDRGDSWSLFVAGNGVRRVETVEDLEALFDDWETGVADDQFRSASRLGEAMLDTRLMFPAGKSRRIVLYSDGQETHADIAAALRQLSEEGIDVRLNRLAGLVETEAAVVSVEPATPSAFHGEVVRLKVKLTANQAVTGTLRIVHKGVADFPRQVRIDPGKTNIESFDVPMTTPGNSLWTAELIPDEDHFPINNQSSCSVTVRGKPRVLVLHEKDEEMRPFSRALQEQGFEIDVRGKFGLPDSMEGLLAFDAIMIADMPATAMQPRQMELLKRYVMDFGGGLAMLGSENSFGLGGYYKTPVEEVLPLVSRFEKEKEKPSLAMALVIDKSGSMDGMPIALARQAAKAAVELLSDRDMVGVVGFDGQAQVYSEMRSAAESDAVNAAIDSMAANGGTYMYSGMLAAKDMLENAPAKIRHMIVLGDGQTQPDDHEGLTQGMADAGITVSTVAMGDADRNLMKSIAEIGRGRYYETDDPANVPQIFTKETMQASRSAIKEDLYGTVQTGDHPILAGYSESDLPFTLGYVMTETKPLARLLLVAETGDPLLALQRYGLGTGLAYTSDVTERWGGEWLAWEECGAFWAQVLRGVLRKADADGLTVVSQPKSDVWKIRIDRSGSNGAPVNDIEWSVTALDENEATHDVPVSQIGLGRYEAHLPLSGHERLTLRLHDRDHDKLKVLSYHRPYPAEYRLSNSLPPALAVLTPIGAEDIRDEIRPQRRRKSIAHLALFAALACLLAGLVLRRV